jgi:very-short-patch-repair endonuclease
LPSLPTGPHRTPSGWAIRLLRNAGITRWELGYRIQDILVDLAFPLQLVAIEVDGWAWHVDADRFVGDRRRQNALVNLRWTVLRFTWHDLVGRPDDVVAEIRATLARNE